MILTTTFTAFGKSILLVADTDKIDRNYNDESYAYWVVEDQEDPEKVYEVNIWKENGEFTTSGMVYAFANRENFEYAGDADEEIEISFAKC